MCMNSINVGNIVKGQITGVTPYGVFVSLEDDYSGLVHISEVSDKFVKDLPMLFNIGDRKSPRLNSVHLPTSYAVFCWKKKKNTKETATRTQ